MTMKTVLLLTSLLTVYSKKIDWAQLSSQSVLWYAEELKKKQLIPATRKWVQVNEVVYGENGGRDDGFARIICAGRMKLACLNVVD